MKPRNRTESMANCLSALQQAIATAQEIISRLSVSNQDHLRLLAGALQLSILDHIAASRTLLQSQHAGSAFILLRAAWEILVDLTLLSKDQEFGHVMHLAHLVAERKIARAASEDDGQNPWLADLAAHTDIKSVLEGLDEESGRLEEVTGYKSPPSLYDRAEKAGLLDQYDGLYRALSAEAHSDLGSLEKRFFSIKTGTIVGTGLFPPSQDEEVRIVLTANWLLECSMDVTSRLFDVQSTGKAQLIEAIKAVKGCVSDQS